MIIIIINIIIKIIIIIITWQQYGKLCGELGHKRGRTHSEVSPPYIRIIIVMTSKKKAQGRK